MSKIRNIVKAWESSDTSIDSMIEKLEDLNADLVEALRTIASAGDGCEDFVAQEALKKAGL